MDLPQIINLSLFIILIIASALFSMTETAFLSQNKIRIQNLAEEGNKRAETVKKLTDNSDRLFATILVLNNLANIGASSLVTALVISLFGQGGEIVAFSTGIVTLLILIFGEITPKSFATKNSEKIVLTVAPLINFFVFIFTPIVFLLNIITTGLIKLLGGTINETPTITEEELKTIVNVGHEEGVLEEAEKDMIHNVFEFNDTEIREIMTPRINVDTLNENCTYEDLKVKFKEGKYSRYPIHDDSYDEIIGVLHIKDMFFIDLDRTDFDVKKYMRDPFFVYEFNQIDDVFAALRAKHMSLAIVLDEYGVMSGIVTLEDIVEEIVGEIDDEYDINDRNIIKIAPSEYVVDGSISLFDLNDEIGTEFESNDFESIGGLVLGALNGAPKVGDKVTVDNADFRVLKLDKNRIEKLKIVVKEKEEEASEE